MPDEFKNLGQSLVATSLFANNILLALTSGYWDLASEFKPLLHTWSLGVEEQYYVVVPILLLMAARFGGGLGIAILLWVIFLSSFSFANWFVNVSPNWAFYLLPTRAWEIGIGALAAFYLRNGPPFVRGNNISNFLSLVGLIFILFSIFYFDKNTISPGWHLLAPTFGAVLIILFCDDNSVVFKILGSRIFVFCGVLSYSLYLWHQPFFAFLRAYSLNHPSSMEFSYLIPFIFLFSFFTWRYIETPFRNKVIFGRGFIFILSICFSLLLVVVGLFLNKSYGMPGRVFAGGISVGDMDKRIYNEKAFAFKRDYFSNKSLTNILIIGNSHARDFTNTTLENFNTSRSEIIYRDDLEPCIRVPFAHPKYSLYDQADVIVFASGDYKFECYSNDIAFAEGRGKKIFYIGPKDFGYNVNWLIRLDKSVMGMQYNPISASVVNLDRDMARAIPPQYYISLLAPTLHDGRIPITDSYGRMLSTDRAHLTKYGAIYFGQTAILGSPYSDLFK